MVPHRLLPAILVLIVMRPRPVESWLGTSNPARLAPRVQRYAQQATYIWVASTPFSLGPAAKRETPSREPIRLRLYRVRPTALLDFPLQKGERSKTRRQTDGKG